MEFLRLAPLPERPPPPGGSLQDDTFWITNGAPLKDRARQSVPRGTEGPALEASVTYTLVFLPRGKKNDRVLKAGKQKHIPGLGSQGRLPGEGGL